VHDARDLTQADLDSAIPQILVIEQGRIIERGTHNWLLGLNGRYRRMYDRQGNIVSIVDDPEGSDARTTSALVS
jgi:ABC-type transport system involved in cytochrome bd biosynthesis fused ATPase/permease subunit